MYASRRVERNSGRAYTRKTIRHPKRLDIVPMSGAPTTFASDIPATSQLMAWDLLPGGKRSPTRVDVMGVMMVLPRPDSEKRMSITGRFGEK